MSGFDWFLVAWWVVNIVTTVAVVGKVRKPIEPLSAAFTVLIFTGFIAGLLVSRGAIT